jgi:hypothetical protein
MKRLILTLALVSLALPTAALGKGPSAATIDGPGGGGGITFTGCCEPGSPTMNLAEQAGFFPAVFRQTPDPMLDQRPKGDLGPKYTITYTVPGPNNDSWTIKQDVYPYAPSGAVTYMKPGQDIFEIGGTRGGWFQAGPDLKQTLVAAGLPASASGATSHGWSFPTLPVSLLTVMLLVVVATAVLVRRRARPAAA